MSTIHRLVLFTALMAGDVSGQVVIVNWGGAYVSTQTPFSSSAAAGSNFGNAGGTSTPDSQRTIAFSEAVPLNPITGYSGTSSEFFGGATWIRYDGGSSPGAGFARITNNAATDAITFRMDGPSAGFPISGEGYGLVLWQENSFLNAGGSPVGLGAESSLSITLTTASVGEVRWIARNGDLYFVSESTFTTSTTLADPASIRWAPYDPGSNLQFTGSEYSFVTLQNLTGVGVYFGNNGITWNTAIDGAPRIDIEGFAVSATFSAIPEPATYTLIAGALALLGAWWRRLRAGAAAASAS